MGATKNRIKSLRKITFRKQEYVWSISTDKNNTTEKVLKIWKDKVLIHTEPVTGDIIGVNGVQPENVRLVLTKVLSRNMKNSLENKKLYIAHHFNQFVMKIKGNDDTLKVTDWFKWDDASLELTPLSLITDEDAIEILKIKHGQTIKIDSGSILSIKDSVKYTNDLICNQIDYLRSKGYALPWMGISIEELIEWGWLKLKIV